jgi:hypothetical protein
VLTTVLIMVFVFPYADMFRRDNTDLRIRGVVELLSTKGDYDSYPQLQNSVEYIQGNGYSYGFQAAAVVTFWIPRRLWEGKPTDTAIVVANDHGYKLTNLSEPLWGEAFINGGWCAVLALFGLLGFFIRSWDSGLRADLTGQTWRAVVAPICAFYMFIVLRGSLLQATGYLAMLLACLLVVRARRRCTARPVPPSRRRAGSGSA